MSGVCILPVCRKVDSHEVLHLLVHIDYRWFIIATGVAIFKMWLSGLRWRYLVSSKDRPSISKNFHFYAIGTMVNMTLFFRLGDLIRARMIAHDLGIPTTKALATIASEHVVDVLVLGALFIGCLLSYSYVWPSNMIPIVLIFLFMVLVFFVSVRSLLHHRAFLKQIRQVIYSYLPKRLLFLPPMITHFYSGFFQITSVLNGFIMFGLTGAIFIAQGVWIDALLGTLGISASLPLGFEATLILVVMMGLAVMLPSSPGYIGTFHFMIVFGLTQLGVPKSVALSYAILAHAHTMGLSILVGCYSLWKEKIKFPLKFNGLKKSMMRPAGELL